MVKGDWADGPPGVTFSGVSTDSRTVRAGDLFFALRGERFDGHEFIGQARQNGAGGVVVSDREKIGRRPAGFPVLVVEDTLRAFQDLARHNRRTIDPRVIGVTGSNGKTTVKEMIGAILSRRFQTLISHANFNNHVGVPLNLFRLAPGDQWAVLEMGMSAPGEIALLCRIAEPTWGLITNVTEAHTEFFQTIDDVRKAKGELVDFLGEDSTVFLNADDPGSFALRHSVRGKLVTFGVQTRSDTVAESVSENGRLGHSFILRHGSRRIPIHLPLPGRHNVANAAAAAAVGFEAGCTDEEIIEGLSNLLPLPMRMEGICLKGSILLFNDTYNANPASTLAAIDTLVRFRKKGRCFLALGEMLELGAYSEAGHRQVGKKAAEARLNGIVTLGGETRFVVEEAVRNGMPPDAVTTCSGHEEAANWLLDRVQEHDLILVKGSRSTRMDLVADAIVRATGRS